MPPHLPNELWHKIFVYAALPSDPSKPFHSWARRWLTLRQVSKSFRAHLAKTYLDGFLTFPGRCVVNFNCGRARIEGVKRKFEVVLMFHSMDPHDESRIVFREVEEGEGENEERTTSLEAYAAKKHRLWKSTMDAYLGRIDGMPDLAPHVLSIYGVSTDSTLADLRYDLERREISFRWEQTLNDFIIECAKVQQKVEVMCEGEPTMDEEAVIAKYGEERGWHRLLVAILRIRGEAFRRVRREKVAKRYREVFGKEFEIGSLDLKHERRQIRRIQWAEFREAGIENMSGVSVEAEEEVREIDRNELGSNDIHDWSDDSDDNYLYRRMDSSDEETEPDSADDSDDGVMIVNGHTK